MMRTTPDTVTLKRAYVPYCQVCGRPFEPIALVYYVREDGNICCVNCARESGLAYEPRIYVKEE
jgi:ribosomal protein L24E